MTQDLEEAYLRDTVINFNVPYDSNPYLPFYLFVYRRVN